VVLALHQVLGRRSHVVAQVVEAAFVVGAAEHFLCGGIFI